MASENSPLLADDNIPNIHDHEAVYRRFSDSRKRGIVALVSWSALLPMFASGVFIPSMPQIAADLNSTPEVISLAVSLSVFAFSTGGLVYAVYSTYYGRRVAYLAGSPLLFIGSMGVCYSKAVPDMLFWRCIQALGTSGGMSIGASVIGDIYKITERGRALGIFLGAALLGPAISPLAGGWGAHYASWRWTQFCLGIAGLFTFVMLYVFLPETSHPGARGLDKYRAEHSDDKKFVWVWLNPFASYSLLRSPNILLATLAAAAALWTDFVLMMPIAYTIGVRYNITNELFIGACFIPLGLGNMIGAPLAGVLADRAVIRSIAKHGPNVWMPEERLKAALIGALIPVPLSILLSGLITQFVPGTLGLVLNMMCFFMNGIGLDLVLTPISAYTVDIMRHRSAEILAGTTSFRSIIMAVFLPLVIPSLKRIGVAATDAIAAGISFSAFVFIVLVIRNGQKMRDWVDVGFTKIGDA